MAMDKSSIEIVGERVTVNKRTMRRSTSIVRDESINAIVLEFRRRHEHGEYVADLVLKLPAEEIIICRSTDTNNIAAAFSVLRPMVPCSIEDSTLVTCSDGNVVSCVSTASLSFWTYNFTFMTFSAQDRTCVLRAGPKAYAFYGSFCLAGLIAATCGLMYLDAMAAMIGLALASSPIMLLLPHASTVAIGHDTVRISRFGVATCFGEIERPLTNALGLLPCKRASVDGPDYWELNLVFQSDFDDRVHILTDSNDEYIAMVADKIATVCGLPLLRYVTNT